MRGADAAGAGGDVAVNSSLSDHVLAKSEASDGRSDRGGESVRLAHGGDLDASDSAGAEP